MAFNFLFYKMKRVFKIPHDVFFAYVSSAVNNSMQKCLPIKGLINQKLLGIIVLLPQFGFPVLEAKLNRRKFGIFWRVEEHV